MPAGPDRPPRVLVVGSVNRDYVCRVDRLPAPGETRLGGELSVGSGGKGGNQAVAAALVGAAYDVGCGLVGGVGDDPDGAALLADLVADGVDVGEVMTLAGVRTGAALITVGGDGENAIVVAPGANHALDGAAVTDAMARSLRPGDVVVLQGELTMAVTATALRAAAAAGARAVLNLAPAGELPDDVLALADPLVVNQSEAAAVLGGAADPQAAVRALARRARSAVVTLGAAGALGAVGDDVFRVAAPALSPAEVVDTTGAGDGCTGALAVALALGRDLPAAVTWGVAVGTAACRRPGAQAAYPRGAEIGSLLDP